MIAGLRNSRRCQARAAVLAAVGLFVFANLTLNLLVETNKPEWRDPEWGWRIKRLRELESRSKGRPLLVVLGSSRTQMGFSPADLGFADDPRMPEVFNLAEPGAGPLQMSLAYHRLRESGIRPQMVLLEIMPAALGSPHTVEKQYESKISRLSHHDLRWLCRRSDHPEQLEKQWFAERVIPFSTYRFLLISHVMPNLLPWQQRVDYQWRMLDRWGWLPFPFETIPESYRAEETAKVQAQYQRDLSQLVVTPQADEHLRGLIAQLQADGVRVGLFRMPEADNFRAMYSPEVQSRIQTYIQLLKRDYGLPGWDSSLWLESDAFADSHHLMKHGARKFSQRFGSELRPWLEDLLPFPQSHTIPQ